MDQDQKPQVDPQVMQELKRILEKESSAELTEAEKDFLRARKAYVGKSSREKFAEVFVEKKKEEKSQDPENKKTEQTAQTDTSKHPADEEKKESTTDNTTETSGDVEAEVSDDDDPVE